MNREVLLEILFDEASFCCFMFGSIGLFLFVCYYFFPLAARARNSLQSRPHWDSLVSTRRLLVAGSKNGILASLSRDELGLLIKRVRWGPAEQRERLAREKVQIQCPVHNDCFWIRYLPQHDVYKCRSLVSDDGSDIAWNTYAHRVCPRCVRPMLYTRSQFQWECACGHTMRDGVEERNEKHPVFNSRTGRWENVLWKSPFQKYPEFK